MKYCPQCKNKKPFSEFPRNKRNKDGYHSSCKICHSNQAKLRYQTKRQQILEYHKEYYKANKDQKKQYDVEYYRRNKEKKHRDNKRWNDKNREYLNEWIAEWKRNNPEKVREYSAKRRSKTLLAMPDWLSEEQLHEISHMYITARDLELLTGVPHHVDHIVPLQGSDVCGLHVPWNLRAIPAQENLRKSNKIE
jgi:hypothetical protein